MPSDPQNTIAYKLEHLPNTPGVYLMKNEDNQVIYVGKAINLKNRVRSYFRAQPKEAIKTRHLVQHIRDFEYIIVANESEALVLEDNLIKKYKPKYNINLKDDKSYPYIRITKEEAPRVFLTRHRIQDGSRYFGPYPNVGHLRETLELLRRVYRYRTCSNSRYKQGEICLNAHIDLCSAPCVQAISLADYQASIDDVAYFFAGHTELLSKQLSEQMDRASEALDFETAALKRDQLFAIERISDRQKAISEKDDDKDVIALARDDTGAITQVFFIRGGRILGRESYPLQAPKEASDADLLNSFLTQFYLNQAFAPKQIFIDREVPDQALLADHLSEKHGHRIHFHVPKRGDNADLMAMVRQNAEESLKKRQLSKELQKSRTSGALEDLQAYLKLKNLPKRMECYDISNIQGSDTVASMVVFIDGRPAKKEYRRFRIKTVQGPNDFASMHEVITRRFSHIKSGKDDHFDQLPDLVIIDGGKGQLKYARQAMKNEGFGHIATFALAEEEDILFTEGRNDPIVLPRHSNALYLVQRIRDEAHRFAITYHRSLRGKRQLASILDDIPGVGPKRKNALLTHFGTFSKILSAEVDDLSEVPGISQTLAQDIFNYLKTHQDLQMRAKLHSTSRH